jgi:uncharacterized membrane protein
MDYPTYMQLNAKDVALVSVFSALCVVVGYVKILSLFSLPNVLEFTGVLVFVSGLMFGWVIGALNGAISIAILTLIPYPLTSPAAFLFVTPPILLAVMIGLGSLYGLVGGILGKRYTALKIGRRLIVELAFLGFLLTFTYDVLASVGFYLAYSMYYGSVWDAIYLTFIPTIYMPYPPIIHTFTNTVVFALLVPPLVKAIGRLQGSKSQEPLS